jgi:hypothetical protein
MNLKRATCSYDKPGASSEKSTHCRLHGFRFIVRIAIHQIEATMMLPSRFRTSESILYISRCSCVSVQHCFVAILSFGLAVTGGASSTFVIRQHAGRVRFSATSSVSLCMKYQIS